MADEFQESLQRIEFEKLYQEIQDCGTRIYQVLSFCVAGSVALLSYVFTIDPNKLPYHDVCPPYLLLLPFLVLVPSLLLVQANLNSTARIAGYLVHRYEDKYPELCWQHSIQKYRSKHDKILLRRPSRIALIAVFGGQGVTSFCASLVAFMSVWQHHVFSSPELRWAFRDSYVVVACLSLIAILCLLLTLWKSWGCGKFADELKRWKELDNPETPGTSAPSGSGPCETTS